MSEFSSSPKRPEQQPIGELQQFAQTAVSGSGGVELWQGRDRPAFSPQALECINSIQQLTCDLAMHLAGMEEISRLQHQLERQKLDMQQTIESLYDRIASLEDRLDGSLAS
ncbi:MAG: hypothetical protein AAF704_12105 [Cyanobacteria bacterium P01_D01_bin.123]